MKKPTTITLKNGEYCRQCRMMQPRGATVLEVKQNKQSRPLFFCSSDCFEEFQNEQD